MRTGPGGDPADTGTRAYLGGRWSTDGRYILFQRNVAGALQLFQLAFRQNDDGTYVVSGETQLTTAPGLNLFPNWGWVRTRINPQ